MSWRKMHRYYCKSIIILVIIISLSIFIRNIVNFYTQAIQGAVLLLILITHIPNILLCMFKKEIMTGFVDKWITHKLPGLVVDLVTVWSIARSEFFYIG